jgi:hypothetical protein
VPQPEIHEAHFAPAASYGTPWQRRLFSSEKLVDMASARDSLRLAIVARAAAAADLAAVAGELDRADAMLAQIEASQVELAEEGIRRVANLADRLRDWLAAGSLGDRPACGAVPSAPAPRDEAELTAARLARAGVAADHDRSHAAHAGAVAAVDRARCQVLTAHAQELASRYETAIAAITELQADGGALLGLTISGSPAVSGLVRERLPGASLPAAGDSAASAWAAYAKRLGDDADARLDL